MPLAVSGTVVVAVLGVLAGTVLEPWTRVWTLLYLDAEYGLPAFWSALLLGGAGLVSLARRHVPGLRVLGGLLLFFAVDELFALHEELEAASGTDWQVLYAPLGLLGAATYLLAARTLRRTCPRCLGLVTAGFGFWAVSQVLEKLQWGEGDQPVSAYALLMSVEEILEMSGSLLVLVGLLALEPAREAGQRLRVTAEG